MKIFNSLFRVFTTRTKRGLSPFILFLMLFVGTAATPAFAVSNVYLVGNTMGWSGSSSNSLSTTDYTNWTIDYYFSSAGTDEIKILVDTQYYGFSGTIELNSVVSDWACYTNTNNITFNHYAGTYRISYNTTNNTITVTYISGVKEGCVRPDDGVTIPAGTYIYFDNSDGIFTDGVYLSVASSSNASLEQLDDTYAPKSDTWYTMSKVEGTNYYAVQVTTASPTSRISFWNTNMSNYDDIYNAKGFYNVAFSSTSNTMFTPSAGTDTSDDTKWCYSSNRVTYYSTLGSWVTGPLMISAAASSTDIPEGTTSFTLTGNVYNAESTATYQWQYSTNNSTWTDLEGASGSIGTGTFTYTVEQEQFYRYYRFQLLSGSTLLGTSNTLTIIYEAACGSDYKEVEIYSMNFGTTTVGAAGYESYPYTYREEIADPDNYSYGYGYKSFPYSINDGYAAIVADPYWCGSGVGYSDGTELFPDVTAGDDKLNYGERNTCETENTNHSCPNWFRGYLTDGTKFRDYSVQQQSDDAGLEFGLCLFINYAVNGDSVAFIHQLTSEEQSKMVLGSFLYMEAYAASPAKSYAAESVDMEVRLQHFDSSDPTKDPTDMKQWTTLTTSGKQTIAHGDDWKRLRTGQFELTNNGGLYRLLVIGSAENATGNDVVIDNVRLMACQPKVETYFLDSEGNELQAMEMTSLSEEYEIDINIPATETSVFGSNPDMAIFLYNANATETGEQKYTYVESANAIEGGSNFLKILKVGKSYTITDDSGNETTYDFFNKIPDTVYFVAIVTSYGNMSSDNIKAIEAGTIDPSDNANFAVSETILTYSINCPTKPDSVKLAVGDPTICYTENIDYPQLVLEFNHICDEVKYQLTQGGSAVGDVEKTISAEGLAADTAVIDLANYADLLGWTAGNTYVLGATIKEVYNGTEYCVRETNGTVSITILPTPSPVLTVETAISKCQYQTGVVVSASVTEDEAYTYSYQWQSSTDGGTTFADIAGATSLSYELPATAANGTIYRMSATLTYTDAEGNVTTCGPAYSDQITLTVNDCSELSLAQEASVSTLCDSDEISVTWTLTNNSDYDNQVLAQVKSEAYPAEFTYVSGTVTSGDNASVSYDETNRIATLDVSSMALGATVTVELKFTYSLSSGELPRTESLLAYVSQKNETAYASYTEQTSETMKASTDVTFWAKATTPTTVGNYEQCAASGTKELSDLVTSAYSTLKWYDADGNELSSSTIDTSIAGTTTYKVTDTDTANEKCESDMAEVIVTIKAYTANPTVIDYNECPTTGTYSLSNLVTSTYETLQWYASDATTVVDPASFDQSVTGNTTYYVEALVTNECASEKIPVNVNIKAQAVASDIAVQDAELCAGISATLTASTTISDNNIVFTWYSDAELTNVVGVGQSITITVPAEDVTYYVTVQGDNICENLSGDGAPLTITIRPAVSAISLTPETEKIGIGADVTKTLNVEPDNVNRNVVWTVAGTEVNATNASGTGSESYTDRPFIDQTYTVVVTDDCDNTFEASATVTVIWPTIITPHHVDGYNDDFLVDMGADIELEIFDRWGNSIYTGNNGWPTAEASSHLPGVYYYVAKLPDGNVKKGTIEIFK